jgi:hypothetical protein
MRSKRLVMVKMVKCEDSYGGRWPEGSKGYIYNNVIQISVG